VRESRLTISGKLPRVRDLERAVVQDHYLDRFHFGQQELKLITFKVRERAGMNPDN
jgi:hypothetical protein